MFGIAQPSMQTTQQAQNSLWRVLGSYFPKQMKQRYNKRPISNCWSGETYDLGCKIEWKKKQKYQSWMESYKGRQWFAIKLLLIQATLYRVSRMKSFRDLVNWTIADISSKWHALVHMCIKIPFKTKWTSWYIRLCNLHFKFNLLYINSLIFWFNK